MKFQIPNWLIDVFSEINNQKLLVFLSIIIIIIILSYAINTILLSSVGGIYRIFIAPGVILHELSHAFACLVTGAKVTSINVFKKDGGEVRHTRPLIPIIGQIFISLAPFIIGFLAIYLIARAVGFKPLPADLINAPQNAFSFMAESLGSINFKSIMSWLSFYLIISIAVTMTPSGQDLRNTTLSLLALCAIIYMLIKYLGVNINFELLLRPELIAVLATTALILIGGLFLSIIMAVVSNLIKFK
jgi:hypothetical protein